MCEVLLRFFSVPPAPSSGTDETHAWCTFNFLRSCAFKASHSENTAKGRHSSVSTLSLNWLLSVYSVDLRLLLCTRLAQSSARGTGRAGGSTSMQSLPLKRFIHVWISLSMGHHASRQTSLSFVSRTVLWEAMKPIRAKEKGEELFLEKAEEAKRRNPSTVLSASSWKNDKAPLGLSVHRIKW